MGKKAVSTYPHSTQKTNYSLLYYLNGSFTKTVTSKVEKVWMQAVTAICLLFSVGLHPGKQIPSLRRDFHPLSCWKKCYLLAYPFHFFLLYNLHTLSKASPLSLQRFISFSSPPSSYFPSHSPLLIPFPLSFQWEACLCFSAAYFEY